MKKRKKYIGNLLLLVISTSLTLLVVEFVFRALLFGDNKALDSLRQPAHYAPPIPDANQDFLNNNFWKLNYLFTKNFNLKNPHPLLGWVGFFDPENYIHFENDKVNGKTPVLLFGDSYAQCVDTVFCFEDYLNKDSSFLANHYFLNYGVGGYGVDQTYLLFNEAAPKYEKPFIIFSLLTTDLDRSVLQVRDAQKPYFVLENNELNLQGVPIELSSEEYFKQNPPKIKSYLWNRFKSSDFYPQKPKSEVSQLYQQKIKDLNKKILEETFKKLKQMDVDFLVFIFQPEWHNTPNWRMTFLRDFCLQNDVPHICDVDIRKMNNRKNTGNIPAYSIEQDGHPTSYLNKLIAEELKKYILDTNYRKQVKLENLNWRNAINPEHPEFYKSRILNSPDWMESIRVKAEQRNISVDSMIDLDVAYMLEQHVLKSNN